MSIREDTLTDKAFSTSLEMIFTYRSNIEPLGIDYVNAKDDLRNTQPARLKIHDDYCQDRNVCWLKRARMRVYD